MTLPRSTTTVPDVSRPENPDKKDPYRRAIRGLLTVSDRGLISNGDRYEIKPGSSLSIKTPKEDILSGASLAFVMVPGALFTENVQHIPAWISAFWVLPKEPGVSVTVKFFCGGKDGDMVTEEITKNVGDELAIGRHAPVFQVLLGLNTVSKQHARIVSKLEQKDGVITILDGSPERPSSYGSTIFTFPQTAISHTGEVTMRRHSRDLPIALR